MTVLKDITDLLQRWDVWKRVSATPDRLDALEKRVEALEEAARESVGMERCPSCGKAALRVVSSAVTTGPLRALGVREHNLKCTACSFTDVRMID